MSHTTLMNTRWTLTAGLVVLAAVAVAWAPRLVSSQAQVEVAEAQAEAMGDWCVRVGKLECCVAEEE